MIERVVHSTSPHKHLVRGDVDMKEYTFGNSRVIIHSDLVHLSEVEQKEWFESEKKKGNKVLEEIEEAVNACYQ